jgi:hypothetical protein
MGPILPNTRSRHKGKKGTPGRLLFEGSLASASTMPLALSAAGLKDENGVTRVLVICTNSNPARVVPFVVHECTQFWDRNRPDYEEMTELALSFSEGRRKATPGFRQRGFESVPIVVEDQPEDTNQDQDQDQNQDQDVAARAR